MIVFTPMSTSFASLPPTIHRSAPITALEAKLSAVTGHGFDYAAELCNLYKSVKPEVARMALLFPEYTPHDAELHLDRLFPLAETLMGHGFFEALTCDELFLLSVGLIAHDWGMAVGDREIEALIHGGGVPETEQDGFALLDDEVSQLARYISERRLPIEDGRCPALTQPAGDGTDDARHAMQRSPLPEYVRRTHAWRSGARLRRRWGKDHPALAEAAAEVCIGHWLDLSKLDTQRPFAAPRALLGHSRPPNLRAVAIAVRLTDLFDIGSDRTPYALWRYIHPQNLTSQLEWQKHRCLDPVVTESDGHGQRTPVLSGRVDDHEVWAAIVDLRRYCVEQLRGCGDIMRRHHHSDMVQRGHPLPWTLRSEVEFKVEPEGFKPVEIRFEFDRQNILQLLGGLLYQGDSHVFLRELLQNAIDANRLRRARHQLEAEDDPNSRPPRGIIYFDVKHGQNGDATVTCRDSGIGMDEVTVRNYLAKAGTSFWQSDQFQSMNPGFIPIGCFGIGMLSCFSVGDEVEVLTKRYDWPDPKTEPLRIRIPNVAHQFRVEHAPETTPAGTSITVRVLGERLRELWGVRHAVEAAKMPKGQHPAPPLQVTEYLKRIAGFVQFPIVVDEHGKRTVIVHPDYESLPVTLVDGNVLENLEREAKGKGLHWNGVHRLVRDYGWSDEVMAQFANSTVKPSQVVVDLKEDLEPEMINAGMRGIEGWLIYPEPSDAWCEFAGAGGLQIISPFGDSNPERAYQRHGIWDEPNGLALDESTLDAPSAELSSSSVVYRNGLLVSGLSIDVQPRCWRGQESLFHDAFTPVVAINLPGTSPYKIEPSRLNLTGVGKDWSNFLWEGVFGWLERNCVVEKIIKSTVSEDPETMKRRFFCLRTAYSMF